MSAERENYKYVPKAMDHVDHRAQKILSNLVKSDGETPIGYAVEHRGGVIQNMDTGTAIKVSWRGQLLSNEEKK